MKKIAILIYPEFSLQEIGDIMYLFRWSFDVKAEIIASTKTAVTSEEGVSILPDKSVSEFVQENYYCLILPGCSNFFEAITDSNIISFLKNFKKKPSFVIGAIGSAPILLSYAGLLDNKKFINSLFEQLNEQCSFIKFDNIVRKPVVVDQNIVTADGREHRKFAIAVARAVGFEVSDKALREIGENYSDDDFIHRLEDDDFIKVKEQFSMLFD